MAREFSRIRSGALAHSIGAGGSDEENLEYSQLLHLRSIPWEIQHASEKIEKIFGSNIDGLLEDYEAALYELGLSKSRVPAPEKKAQPEKRIAAVSPNISRMPVGRTQIREEIQAALDEKKKKKKKKVSKAIQKRVSKKIAILKKEKVPAKQAIATAIAMGSSDRLDKHGEYKKKKKMKEIYNWQAKANAHKIKVKWINPRKFTGYAAREKLQPLEETENE